MQRERIIVLLDSDNFPIRRNARARRKWKPFFIRMLAGSSPLQSWAVSRRNGALYFPRNEARKIFESGSRAIKGNSGGESGHGSKPIWSRSSFASFAESFPADGSEALAEGDENERADFPID